MKKLSLLLMGIICATAVIAQSVVFMEHGSNLFNVDGPYFSWTQTAFDFGKVKVGHPVTHEFSFTNSGNDPLLITSVKASCGCTVTEYSKDPIPVGAKGFVKATYDAAKAGIFTKTVTVNANTEEGVVVLTIKGEVVN